MKKEINHISVIIPSYNVEAYTDAALTSIINQDYPDFEIVFIDDNSTDRTFEIAQEYAAKFPNMKCIRNDKRKFPLENFKIGVENSQPGSICVLCDGDDYYKHENVLHRINKEYSKYDCWVTFGTYEHVNPYSDVSAHYHPYPDEVIANNSFRSHKWLASHIRTCRKELFEMIKNEDLIDPATNNYFAFNSDLATMWPMMEMASGLPNKIRYIPDVMYCYNVGNPISENKVNQKEIDRIEALIRSSKPYNPILELSNA